MKTTISYGAVAVGTLIVGLLLFNRLSLPACLLGVCVIIQAMSHRWEFGDADNLISKSFCGSSIAAITVLYYWLLAEAFGWGPVGKIFVMILLTANLVGLFFWWGGEVHTTPIQKSEVIKLGVSMVCAGALVSVLFCAVQADLLVTWPATVLTVIFVLEALSRLIWHGLVHLGELVDQAYECDG